ncbi:MAG: hypothetical protein GYA50_07415 [Eubacteriaceae bacterium]|nr:hypothetical protein [Eubacteriaceae bacterium]
MNRLTEKIVGSMLLTFLVLTVSFQVLITRNVINPVSAVDLREDISAYESSDYYPRQYSVTLNLSDENAKIMVNGYYIEQAADKSGDITFSVYSGDVVECDLRACQGEVMVKLVGKDNLLSVPADNFYAQSSNNILYLFKTQSSK